MKKRGLLALLFGMAVMSFTILNSCDIDIGLGSAVDTEPPTLTIENPPASKIIRDAFPICGTFSDDGSISAITVVLTNTETQQEYPKIDGTWGKENTWSAVVDPVKSKIPDGKYEAKITISDNGGHHSVSTRSFVIDNTAPVVILSRPASAENESDTNKIESYGQYITLEGQAADDNEIEKIVIKFYSKADPDKAPIVKEITSIPPTISLDVAKFMDENDSTYTDLYGEAKDAGEKEYYCTISAFDGAKRYPAKGDEKADDDYGNEESTYILWTDWEKFQKDYSNTTGSTSKIKVPDLYSIKAGKSTGTQERSVSEKTLISDFFHKAISRGIFKLNPLNNPSYSISGLDIGVANDVENERSLTIQLSKGLDGISLDSDNMKVYLIPITIEDDGTETRGNKIYPQQSKYERKGDGQFLTVIQKDNVKDADGKDTSLVYGTTYVIGVDGADTENNKIVPSFDGKEFFIRFKAKNVAPGLTIDEPLASTSYLKKGDTLLIKGTTSVPDGYPTVSITCKKGEETIGKTIYTHKVKDSDKQKIEGGLIYYNWEFEVPTSGTADEFFFDQGDPDSEEDASDQYVFDITSDLDSMPTSRTKTIIYDLYGPTISIDTMLPTAEKYNALGDKQAGDYLNGDVTMKVSILDDYDSVNTDIKDSNNDKRPYYIITDENETEIPFRVGTESVKSIKHYITTPAKQQFKIKTEDIASGTDVKNIKVKIFAEDRAGNKGVDIDDRTKKYYERSYTVDQSTDIPWILPKNSATTDLTYTKEQAQDLSNTEVNVYFANQTVMYKMIDDDGLAYAKYQVTKVTDDSEVKAGTIDTKGASEYQLEVTMPDVPGTYKVYLETKDTNTLVDTGSEPKTTSKSFYIRVTAAAPTIQEITLLSTIFKGSDLITPTIKISSDQVPFVLQRIVKDADGNEITALSKTIDKNEKSVLETESPEVVDSILISDGISSTSTYKSGNYTIYYKVKDKNSRWSEEYKKNFTVDLIPPVISEVKVADVLYAGATWNNSKTLALQVQASDEHISTVEYSLNNSTYTALSHENAASAYTGTAVFNNEGATNTLYIRAKDTAGNITYFDGTTAGGTQTLSSVNVKIDTSVPNLSAKFFQKGTETPVAKENSIYVKDNTKLTVYGNYEDALSGAAELSLTLPSINESAPTVKYSTTAIGDTVASIPAATEYKLYSEIADKASIKSWKAEFTPKASGEFYIQGSDLVSTENKNTTAKNKVFDINYDKDSPEFELSIFKGSDGKEVYYNSTKKKYYVNNTNKTFELTGTSSDNIGVESVTLKISENGTTNQLNPSRATDSTLGRWKFTGINMQSWTGTGATAVITVTDKAGNSDSTTLNIVFDTTKPVATHNTDDSGKDLYFRIGDYKNDGGDLDVGGKYSSGTFANSTSLLVRGNFADEENGSGINQYYYRVYSSAPTKVGDELISDVVDSNTKGTFKPSDAPETKRVDFNVTSTNKATWDAIIDDAENNTEQVIYVGPKSGTTYYQYRRKIVTNYKTTISSLSEGTNYVVIVAEDNAGNRNVDTVTYSLNVDTTVPKVTKIEGDSITINTDVVLTVTMEDGHLDSPEVVIKKGETEIAQKATVGTVTASGTCDITIPFSSSEIPEGTYTIEVRAKDEARNLSDPATKTIIKDTTPPVIEITKPAGESSTYIKDNNYKFEGKITELNEIGTATADLYKVGETTAKQTATLTPKRTNGSNTEWTWSWQVYGLEASDYFVKINAQDLAGNSAVEQPSDPIKLDNTAPIVKVTATGLKDTDYQTATTLTSKATYYAGQSYEITVEVDDVNFDYDDEICVSENTVTSKKGTTANTDFSVSKVSAKSFKITPTYNSTDINGDGTYEFTISVKDKAGNESDPVIIKVQRDITPPEVKIQSPSEPEDGKINVIKGESYSFRISAKDGSGVGVANLAYAFSQNSDAPADNEWVSDNKFTDGEKIIEMPLVSGKIDTTDEDGNPALHEGNWYLYAKSADKSGNATTTLAKREFTVDLNNPSISVEGLVKDKTNILSDEVGEAGYELKATVSDTNAVATSNKLVVKVDEKQISENSGKWIIKNGELKANNSIKVELIATDIVGNKTTETYYLYNDTLAPTLEVTAPVEAEAVGSPTSSAITIKGTASDDGYGVEKVEYVLYSGDVDKNTPNPSIIKSDNKEVNSTNFPLEKKGEQWKIAASTGMPLGDDEGQMTLAVTVTENKNGTHGGRTTTVYRPFYYDKANPNLDENGIGPAGKTTNGGTEKKFSLSGTSSDSNALESVTIKWKVDNKDKSITLTPTEAQKKSMSWSQDFAVGLSNQSKTNYVADGTNEFTIIAKDISGKEKQLTRTVIVDTVAPTCGTLSITSTGKTVGTGTDAKTWYNTSFINIQLENVKDENGTGISKVEYTTETGDSAKWYPMSGSGTTYTATVNCTSQGLNSIRVKVTDAAGTTGNETAAGTKDVYIDTNAPTLGTSKVKYLTGDFAAVSELLINGKNSYQLQIEASDAANNSGVASVTYFYGNDSNNIPVTTPDANGKWNITVPVGDDTVNPPVNGINKYDSTKTNAIYAIIKDNAGNEVKERILTVTKDTTPPSVEFKSVTTPGSKTKVNGVDVDDVNGTITISGSASDTNKLDTVVLKYQKAGDGDTTWTDLVQKSDSTANNWTAELNTSGLDNNKKYTLKAIATDAAGNTKEVTKDIYVNQDTDRPVITLTNIDLTVATFGNNEIYGNVSDDDGVPASISYYIGNDEPDKNTTWTPPAANSNFTYTSGSFKLKLADGSQKIWFKVNDGTNDFVSSSETSYTNETSEKILKSVKVVDSQSNEFGYLPKSGETSITASVINTTVDTTAPYITKLEWAYPEATGTPVWQSINSKPTAGGTGSKTNINIHVYAYDINGVDTVKLMVPKNSSDKSTVSGYSTKEEDLDEKYYIYNFTKDETSTYDDEDSNITYIKWTSPAIIATGMESGIRECKLQVFDGEKTTQETVSLTIDNSPADFEITNYADNQTVYGIKDIEVQGMVTANDMAHVYYCLTKGDITTAPAAGNSWKTIKFENSRLNSVIKFDGDTNATDVTHEIRLRDWLKTLYEIDDIDNHNDTEKLKLWTYVVDTMENSSEPKALTLNVIPNGDKPVVKIIYPGEGLKLGGTIRFSGETTIETSSVDKVYAQIIVPDSIDNSNDDWVTKLDKLISDAKNKSTGSEPYYKVVNIDSNTKGIEVSGTPTSWNFAINSHHELEKDNATPNYTVNFIAKSATNKLSDTMTRTIQIDKNAPSLGDLQLVKLKDESADNKFADINIDKRIPYTEDMWISGQWYLLGSVTDGNGVQELLWHDGSTSHTLVEGNNTTNTGTIKDSAKVKTLGAAHSTDYPDPEYPDDETKKITITAYDYEFFIPIGATSGYGAISYSLSAVDATNERNSVSRTIKVNYDCTAPEFKATVSSSDDAAELSATGNKIQNSSGMYSVYGTFDEEGKQSGFARIAMYFTRTIGSTTNVIDPMVAKGTTNKKDNYYAISNTELSLGADGIYWKALSGGSTADNKITISNIPAWVRKGGICKVDGVIYKIKTVTTSDLTVDGTLTTGSGKTVYVTPALVIDNLSSESKKQGQTYNGLYNKDADDTTVISGGDGDWLIEGVSQQGSSYPWTASLNSQNMLDGPVTIHFVAFDKAGNATEKSYSGNVANNAPRLAGVTVWTDYNGNGKGWRNTGDHAADYEDETKSRYYSRVHPTIAGKATDRSNDVTSKLIVSGNQNDAEGIAAASSTAFMKVTDTVKFIPEIVGGNGALNYEYKIGKKAAFTVNATTKEVTGFTPNTTAGSKAMQSSDKAAITKDDGTAVSGTDDGQDVPTATDSNSVTYVNGNTDSVITFDGATILGALDNSTSDDPTWFDVVISDSTEGDTKLSCEMQIALQINYKDETPPDVKIRPFYWNGLSDNSVYTTRTSVTSVADLEGHIELEDDLPNTFKDDDETIGIDDRDPKVSGKIKVEGYAYDDIKLKEIWVQFAGHSKLNTAKKVASYTPSATTKWSVPTGTSHVLGTDGWDFTAQDVYCNSNGHMVYWRLILDTEKLDNIVGLDKALVVYADDDRGTVDMTHTGTTQTDFDYYHWSEVKDENNASTTYYTDFYCFTPVTNLTSDSTIVYKKSDLEKMSYYYKMDVVPYITGVQTRLAKMNRPNPTIYSRTARGHYPIASDETATGSVTLEGFNLSTSGTVDISSEIGSKNSGPYSYTVGTGTDAVESFNNKNNNDACGSYILSTDPADEKSNALNQYNRQPNTTTNLKLTDDVYFDMWEINNRAAVSKGALKEPMMKINPKNNMVGFGFVNDIDSVSFPTDTLSYTIMQKNNKDYVGTTFAYDSNGHAHTISIGLDAQAHTGIAGRMNYINSRWVTGSSGGVRQWDKRYAIALESIGIPAGVSVKGHIIPYTEGSSLGRIDIERFPNPAITIANHTTNNTDVPTVYIMYYDAEHDQIRFRYGEVTNTGANRTNTQYGLLNDSKCEYYIHSSVNNPTNNGNNNKQIPNADNNTNTGNDYNNHGMFEASKDYYALVAGNYYKQRNDGKTGNVTEGANPIISTGNKGSKYYAMDVYAGNAIENDKVVMIWYDNTANKLMYMYRENLTAAGDNTDASVNGVTGKWSKPKAIFEKMLQDCTIKVDPQGGIHIAAYDQTDADLLYAYLPTYNHLDTEGNKPYTSIVDAYSQVGKYIVIDTVLDGTGTKVIPYISYFTEGMSSLPKLAFIPEGIDKTSDATRKASIKDGSDSTTNIFTGAWEVTLLPTKSPLQQYKVCVGAFRDENSKTTKPDAKDGTTPTVTNGVIYPNGITDLVVGYSIRENGTSYMETAMRK